MFANLKLLVHIRERDLKVLWRDSKAASFYLRYILVFHVCYSDQFTHNTLQVCRNSDSIFIDLSSSHELGQIEVRLERIWCPSNYR